MSKGFTLVELSIVLVIIGLLVGGILAAQSMISASKFTKAIAKINEFDVALNNFKTKYNSLPGDSTSFGGNGDGYVIADTIVPAAVAFDGEFSRYWVELNQSGFDMKKNYTSTIPLEGFDIKSNTPNAPDLPFGTDTGVIFYSNAITTNSYQLGKISISGGYVQIEPSFKGEEARALDIKMDDGGASTGNVTGFSSSSVTAQTAGLNGCKTSLFTSIYNTSSTEEKCVMLVKAIPGMN